ncbi:MAG: bifunctional UDP-N-acetylglucosamine diphosphorylase/glucosamine-1-phosphate N-acetyltransferase GlmU [Bacillota bacterium]
MHLATVVLAAGKGTRMKSGQPKVLHNICGLPMICHVLQSAMEAGSDKIIVVAGFGGDLVAKEIEGLGEVVYQHEQLGTAHALLQAAEALKDFSGDVMVLCGDTPLITSGTLKKLIAVHRESGAAATVLTSVAEIPEGYGRVIRGEDGRVLRIVEQKDASPDELAVREINTGMYCFKTDGLFEELGLLKPDNAQGEYYLTDLIEKYVVGGKPVNAVPGADLSEIMGVNDRVQLAAARESMAGKINRELMLSGVTIIDPLSVYIDVGVKIGCDTVIYPGTLIQGSAVIGSNCRIGPFTQVLSARVGDNVTVRQSVIEDSIIGDGCNIGPYSYIRPGCVLDSGVKVGDFVELKKARIGRGSKVPHLSYMGDADIGQNVNVGAGTITCNYDGEKKWQTHIGDNAFIGSNTNLVAPVKVGRGSVTGAGSTITKDVPDGALGVTRDVQRNVPGWSGRKKKVKVDK